MARPHPCLLLERDPGRPLAFVRLATQFENAGDGLIHRELLRLLAARADLCIDARGCPRNFVRQVTLGLARPGELRTSRWPFFLRMLVARLLRRRCFWFLAPGASTGALPAAGLLPARVRDLALPLAWGLGVRVCQVGSSFGGLAPAHLEAWRWRRRWLAHLRPRDETSAAYLRGHGVPPDPCIPDLAFNLFEAVPTPGRAGDGRVPTVCLSFRTDQDPGQAADVTAGALALCRRSDPATRWRTMVQVARDLPGMEALRRRLLEAGFAPDPVVDLHDDLDGCLASFREVSLVVSNRLHVLLMAASRGARILAVTDGPGGAKLEGILGDLGLQAAATTSARLAEGRADDLGVALDGTGQRARLRRAFDELISPT